MGEDENSEADEDEDPYNEDGEDEDASESESESGDEDEDGEEDDEDDDEEDNEEGRASNDAGATLDVSPSTTPHKFICCRCTKPLETEIWKCTQGMHFVCSVCNSKLQFPADVPHPCPVRSCSGRKHTSWVRDSNLENQLHPLLESCPQCGHKYLPELKDIHRQHCYAGAQTCNFCSTPVEQNNYLHHLGSCMGGFEIISGSLKLTRTKNPKLYQCEKSAILLGEKNCFCHLAFSIDGVVSANHPKLILGTHPSKSKNGWQVWLTMDTSASLLTEVPESLSSQFKCVLSQNFEGVEYQFTIPLSPVGYIKWAFVPALLLFNRPPPVKLNMHLIGFKAI